MGGLMLNVRDVVLGVAARVGGDGRPMYGIIAMRYQHESCASAPNILVVIAAISPSPGFSLPSAQVMFV
jgi:hypothetical protein